MTPLLLQELHFIDDFIWSSTEVFRHTTGHKTGYRLLLKSFPDLLFYLHIIPVSTDGLEVRVTFTWYQDTVRHEFGFSHPDTPSFPVFDIMMPMLKHLVDGARENAGRYYDPVIIEEFIADAEDSHMIAEQLDKAFDDADFTPRQTHHLSHARGFFTLVTQITQRLQQP